VSVAPEPSRPPTGRLFVEAIRFVLVGLFTAGGWQLAEAADLTGTRLLLAVVLGSLVGYVIGGVIGRRAQVAVSVFELEFQRVPASELLAGALGLILGLVIAVLLSLLIFRLPVPIAYPTAAIVSLVLTYVGYRLGRAKRDEIFALFGLKTRAFGVRAGEVNVLDTSALIDGRIREVVDAGFLGGTLMVHRGVLSELQTIAGSDEPSRAARGRRGMEILRSLQRHPAVEVVLVGVEDTGDVDTTLVRVARERGAALVTSDTHLAKVAEALDVPTRSIAGLAEALRTPVLPGEELTVHVSKEGRDAGQGVGYLEDGTMVVVDDGADRIGSDVRAVVTNVLQTPTGRMVFARLGD
jgi:uncharacterized protein YacL